MPEGSWDYEPREMAVDVVTCELVLETARACRDLSAALDRVEAAVRRTADLIRFGQEEGSFRAGDPEQLAFHVIMAIGGLRSMAPLMDISKPILRRQLSAIRGLVLTEQAGELKETQREEE